MTEEQILELAKTYGIGDNKYEICICWKDELLKFAEAIYEEGVTDGFKPGYEEGYDDGCFQATGGN